MRRLATLTALTIALVLGTVYTALACSPIRFNADLEVFECGPCPEGTTAQGIQPPALLSVSGSFLVINRRGNTSTLGNIAIELQSRASGRFNTVARLVLDEFGNSTVQTCQGPLSDDAPGGHIVLVDENGLELSFAQAKNLGTGPNLINYIATFQGPLPDLDLNDLVRVRGYLTAVGADSSRTCDVDATGDSVTDAEVKTFVRTRTRRIPRTATLLVPPQP